MPAASEEGEAQGGGGNGEKTFKFEPAFDTLIRAGKEYHSALNKNQDAKLFLKAVETYTQRRRREPTHAQSSQEDSQQAVVAAAPLLPGPSTADALLAARKEVAAAAQVDPDSASDADEDEELTALDLEEIAKSNLIKRARKRNLPDDATKEQVVAAEEAARARGERVGGGEPPDVILEEKFKRFETKKSDLYKKRNDLLKAFNEFMQVLQADRDIKSILDKIYEIVKEEHDEAHFNNKIKEAIITKEGRLIKVGDPSFLAYIQTIMWFRGELKQAEFCTNKMKTWGRVMPTHKLPSTCQGSFDHAFNLIMALVVGPNLYKSASVESKTKKSKIEKSIKKHFEYLLLTHTGEPENPYEALTRVALKNYTKGFKQSEPNIEGWPFNNNKIRKYLTKEGIEKLCKIKKDHLTVRVIFPGDLTEKEANEEEEKICETKKNDEKSKKKKSSRRMLGKRHRAQERRRPGHTNHKKTKSKKEALQKGGKKRSTRKRQRKNNKKTRKQQKYN